MRACPMLLERVFVYPWRVHEFRFITCVLELSDFLQQYYVSACVQRRLGVNVLAVCLLIWKAEIRLSLTEL
jgi:hypothetical protein